MVIAALVSFGILLLAWIAAPGDHRLAQRPEPARDLELFPAEGVARAA